MLKSADIAILRLFAINLEDNNNITTLDFELTTDEWCKSLRNEILANPEQYISLQIKEGKVFRTVQNKIIKIDDLKWLVPTDFREVFSKIS